MSWVLQMRFSYQRNLHPTMYTGLLFHFLVPTISVGTALLEVLHNYPGRRFPSALRFLVLPVPNWVFLFPKALSCRLKTSDFASVFQTDLHLSHIQDPVAPAIPGLMLGLSFAFFFCGCIVIVIEKYQPPCCLCICQCILFHTSIRCKHIVFVFAFKHFSV